MIIDACMFFNEVDMLYLRLNILNDTVSHFVVVESLERFGSAKKKESVFLKHQDRFKEFEHKLTHVLVPELHPVYTDVASGWQREKNQRDILYRATKDCISNYNVECRNWTQDILICSDVDEIPNPDVLKQNLDKIQQGEMYRLDMDFFYYNVNSYVGKWPWGTTVGTMAAYDWKGSHDARSVNYPDDRILRDAGWHFSYFGGPDKIREKVKSFSHSQDQIAKDFFSRTDADLKADIKDRRDLYRRPEMNQFEHRSADDPRLPKYFLENRDKFPHFVEE